VARARTDGEGGASPWVGQGQQGSRRAGLLHRKAAANNYACGWESRLVIWLMRSCSCGKECMQLQLRQGMHALQLHGTGSLF